MHPLYFAKIWIKFDGDLWKVWRYLGCNTSIAQLISLYKKVNRHVNNFPKMKLRTNFDNWPEESACEIEEAIKIGYSYEQNIVDRHYKFRRV